MRRLINRIDSGLDRVFRVFEFLAILLLLFMLAINGVNILTRTLFDYSHEGIWPWTMTLFVWWVFVSFFPLYRARQDVSIYVLVRRAPIFIRRPIGIAIHGLIALMAFIMLSTMERLIGLQAGTIEIVGIDRFWLSVPLVASLFFVGLNAVVEALKIAFRIEPFRPFGEVEVL